MEGNTGKTHDLILTHPLDPEDAAIAAAIRAAVAAGKGVNQQIEAARDQFDAFMESVVPREDVEFQSDTIGGVSGIWALPPNSREDEAILHLHGGWFNFGSAKAYRHLVAQIAARAGARIFIADYRLAPEDPFPAATEDAIACYQELALRDLRSIAITGDSAGGNLALGLASRVAVENDSLQAKLVAVAALSPVTDLTLSGASYQTRADADPYFTREQVAQLVGSYLGWAQAQNPLASPLFGGFKDMPATRLYVGDDEVLLDDSLRYADRAAASGVDARAEVWEGMAHGFPAGVGKLKAAAEALDAMGVFLAARLGSL
jgi:epsilon-lactone hydrolase